MTNKIIMTETHLKFILDKHLNAIHLGINLNEMPEANKIFYEIKSRILKEYVQSGNLMVASSERMKSFDVGVDFGVHEKPVEEETFEENCHVLKVQSDVEKYLISKSKVKEAFKRALNLMIKNYHYQPQLKDKKFREGKSKIELERAENYRCQLIIKQFLKELNLKEEFEIEVKLGIPKAILENGRK